MKRVKLTVPLMNGLVLVVSPRCRERMVDRKVLYIRPERLTKALK